MLGNTACRNALPKTVEKEITDYENAIRLAISLGGDADTMAAIAGGIAEAYYKEIPSYIVDEVQKRLPQEFIDVMQRFYKCSK